MKFNDTSIRIMDVALQLFSEQGYYNTTTKQIADNASVNELTLFRHFGTKANLFQETTERYVVDAKVESVLDGVNDVNFEKAMLLITERICNLYEQNRNLYKVQMKHADDAEGFVKLKLSRSFIEVLTKYFTELVEQGVISNDDPHRLATTFVSAVLGIFTVDILGGNMMPAPWSELALDYANQFVKAQQVRNLVTA